MKGLGRNATAALVSTLAFALAPSVASAAPLRVQAVGVETEGTSVVAGSGVVQSISPSGELTRTWGAEGSAPGQFAGGIAALSVDRQNRVWILDGANRVQEFTRDGAYQRGFTIGPCTEPGGTYLRGGLDVGDQYVFAASVCSDEVIRLDKGGLNNRLTIPVNDPDGISYNQYASCGYKLAVARPQSQDVLLFDVNGGAQGSRPVAGRVPDVYLDDFGVVMASDNTRDQIHFYGCDGVEFRTLGRPGSGAGDLDNAMAFDVFGQYGGDLAGNLFIGEYNNARLQRWSSGGFTFFAKALDTTGSVTPTPTPTPDPTPTPTPDPTPTPTPDPPTGRPVGVTIEFHAAFVNTPDVQLRISEPAGATSVLISNDGGFDFAETRALTADDNYAWTLPVSGRSERLPRTVYVRFPGSANPTQTYTDDIVLDTTAPTLRSVSLKGSTLRVTARDSVSGVAFVQVATGTAKSSKRLTARYAKKIKVSSKLGKRPLVRVVDRAGNAGKWKRVKRK